MKFSFTVPTEDVCVLCLKKCPPGGGGGGGGVAKLSNFQPISHYLGLDLREIFNIKRERPLPLVGEDREELVIEVTLCGSCGEWRKAFCDMYREWRGLERRMEESVRGMHGVMVKAERDVKKVREYLMKIVGRGGGGGEGKPLEKVKGSIPEKFRRETIAKSALKKLVKKEEKGEVVKEKEPDLHCDEDLETSDLEGEDLEDAEAEWKLMEELGSGDQDELLHLEEINTSPDAKNQDEDDDEEDPEELMMRYYSMAESNDRSSGDELVGDPLGMGNDLEEQDTEENMEVDEGLFRGPIAGPSSSSSTSGSTSISRVTSLSLSPGKSDKFRIHPPGSYGANFPCDICGRVLVSRKNFELHQRRHAGEKPFECEFCEKTFRDTSNLRSHVLRYHRHFLFIRYKDPAVSLEVFKAGLDHLVQSILTDSTPDDQSSSRVSQGCQLCKRVYTQRFAIEDHIVQRHYDVLGMSIADLQMEITTLSKEECLFYMTQIMADGNTAKACGACSTIFPDPDALNLHIKSHIRVHLVRNQNKKKPNSYKIPSDRKSLIQLKMKCEPCGRYFEDLQALKNHKLKGAAEGGCRFVGSGRDPLVQCEHCGKCLNNVGSHRRHLLSLHRYQVFAKYLPEGAKPAEVEEMIKQIFEEKKPERGTDGFKCFICDKIITQYRKLSSHVLVGHFREMVKLVNKGLREQRRKRGQGETETETDTDQIVEEREVEVIELDGDDGDEEDPDTPKILRLVDSNGEEIQLGGGEGQVEQYLNGLGASGVVHRLVEEVSDDNKIQIEYEYGN